MNAQRIPMLLYHSVDHECDPRFAEWCVSPDLFADHMDHLAARGYRCLTVSEVVERVYERGTAVHPRSVVVTFDDGFADFYDSAWPVLADRGIAATLFVATGYVGGSSRWLGNVGEEDRPMLSWSQVEELSRSGIECGAHGHAHLQLDTVAPNRAGADIAASRAALERACGEVRCFAYPHGYYSAAVQREVVRAGFSSACAVKHALSTTDDDRFALSRVVVRGGTSVDELDAMLTGQTVPVVKRGGAARRGTWRLLRRAGVQRPPRILAGGAAPPTSERLAVISPAPRGVWRDVHAADPEALVSQRPEWVDAICADGSYEDASRLYQTPDGKRLVLPLVRRLGPWPDLMAPLASMPTAWGMGGLLADTPVTRADVAAIAADLRAGPALRTAIRPNPLHAELWAGVREHGATAVPRLAHVLDLDGGAGAVWDRMHKKTRSGVRKAERSGVEVESDASGRLVGVFYGLLELSLARWAEQQHEPLALARWRLHRRDPREKLERMAVALGDAMRVWVAWVDGEPAAATIVLMGANANDTRGAMDKELAAPTRANDLLQWRAIEHACEAGCSRYHLGESGTSRSLAHYKERFGARPVPYAEHRLERLPITRVDDAARGLVKRALRFRDA